MCHFPASTLFAARLPDTARALNAETGVIELETGTGAPMKLFLRDGFAESTTGVSWCWLKKPFRSPISISRH